MDKTIQYVINQDACILGHECKAGTPVFKQKFQQGYGKYIAPIGRDQDGVPICIVGSDTAREYINVTHVHETHELKTKSKYFVDVRTEEKTFEIRYNDRNFQLGDVLILKKIDKDGEYTGREMRVITTYMVADVRFCKPGYVVMGIEIF